VRWFNRWLSPVCSRQSSSRQSAVNNLPFKVCIHFSELSLMTLNRGLLIANCLLSIVRC